MKTKMNIPNGFTAKFGSVCYLGNGHRIQVGEQIVKSENYWSHRSCAVADDQAKQSVAVGEAIDYDQLMIDQGQIPFDMMESDDRFLVDEGRF